MQRMQDLMFAAQSRRSIAHWRDRYAAEPPTSPNGDAAARQALADAGFRVGLVDADLFGPSIPGMLGVPADAKPSVSHDQKVIPVEAQGLKVMSMAMLTGDDAPAVMRGPMVTKYLQLFIGDVAWGGLDYLILDLPPGTGILLFPAL